MEKRSEAEKVSADAAFCSVHGIMVVAEPKWMRTYPLTVVCVTEALRCSQQQTLS